MKLEYSISLDDFPSIYPPLTAKAGNNVGFRAVLVVCVAMALLGAVCVAQGLGIVLGLFLAGLGAFSAFVAYFFERRSIEKAQRKHDDAIVGALEQIHCRDRRELEVNEIGLTMSCRCGSVSRPWAELTSFSENQSFAVIRTKTEQIPITKSAFRSEGELTEFRALVTGNLNGSKPFAARHIDFRYGPADFRSGYLLHMAQAGGWRRVIQSIVALYGFGYILLLVLRSQGPRDNAAAYFAFGTVFLFAIVSLLMKPKRHYEGALRLTFGEEGLYLQDPQTIAIANWNRYVGYLENRNVFLIYANPRLYRIVPKRILGDREKEFATMLKSKLPRYNYKRPIRVIGSQAASVSN